jgi:hypothetical protein
MTFVIIAVTILALLLVRCLFTALFTWFLQWGLLAGFGIAVPFWPLFALTMVATWLLGFTNSYNTSSK